VTAPIGTKKEGKKRARGTIKGKRSLLMLFFGDCNQHNAGRLQDGGGQPGCCSAAPTAVFSSRASRRLLLHPSTHTRRPRVGARWNSTIWAKPPGPNEGWASLAAIATHTRGDGRLSGLRRRVRGCRQNRKTTLGPSPMNSIGVAADDERRSQQRLPLASCFLLAVGAGGRPS
jgi:hypothetical protein